MAERVKTVPKKEEPEGGAKPKPKPKPKAKPKPKPKTDTLPQSQAVVVKKLLENLEKKLSGDQVKASMGDYIRLVQLQKELDEESPREMKVTWVEPEGDTVEKTESENEG